jgi:hypothetical protein
MSAPVPEQGAQSKRPFHAIPENELFAVPALLVIGSILLVELVKRWFYRKYSGFIERKTAIR